MRQHLVDLGFPVGRCGRQHQSAAAHHDDHLADFAASIDLKVQLTPIVWCALLVAFGSATQDIALDAFRGESADSDHQAALAATYQTGYRLALIWSGAGVLWLAARAESGAAGYDPASAGNCLSVYGALDWCGCDHDLV